MDDVQVRMQAKEGWAAGQNDSCVVVIDTELTDDLIAEGYARDFVRLVQVRRKEIGCGYADRIRVGILTNDDKLTNAITEHSDYIQNETQADDLVFVTIGDMGFDNKIAGMPFQLFVEIVKSL